MPVSRGDLSSSNQEQVEQFESFFKKRQRESLSEIEGAFDDNRDLKMLDEMYSREDALNIVRFIEEQVRVSE